VGEGVAKGVKVGYKNVGVGGGWLEFRVTKDPTRLKTTLNTMTMLKMVVRILAPRLLRRLYLLDWLTFSSQDFFWETLYHALSLPTILVMPAE
jgi:hypothetical protein